MPCGTEELTAAQQAAKDAALAELERQIEAGNVRVKVLGEEAVFEGWETDRENPGHWHDGCAFRTLTAQGSQALRMALAREETTTDRLVREVPR
jgi:hypothetical protein